MNYQGFGFTFSAKDEGVSKTVGDIGKKTEDATKKMDKFGGSLTKSSSSGSTFVSKLTLLSTAFANLQLGKIGENLSMMNEKFQAMSESLGVSFGRNLKDTAVQAKDFEIRLKSLYGTTFVNAGKTVSKLALTFGLPFEDVRKAYTEFAQKLDKKELEKFLTVAAKISVVTNDNVEDLAATMGNLNQQWSFTPERIQAALGELLYIGKTFNKTDVLTKSYASTVQDLEAILTEAFVGSTPEKMREGMTMMLRQFNLLTASAFEGGTTVDVYAKDFANATANIWKTGEIWKRATIDHDKFLNKDKNLVLEATAKVNEFQILYQTLGVDSQQFWMDVGNKGPLQFLNQLSNAYNILQKTGRETLIPALVTEAAAGMGLTNINLTTLLQKYQLLGKGFNDVNRDLETGSINTASILNKTVSRLMDQYGKTNDKIQAQQSSLQQTFGALGLPALKEFEAFQAKYLKELEDTLVRIDAKHGKGLTFFEQALTLSAAYKSGGLPVLFADIIGSMDNIIKKGDQWSNILKPVRNILDDIRKLFQASGLGMSELLMGIAGLMFAGKPLLKGLVAPIVGVGSLVKGAVTGKKGIATENVAEQMVASSVSSVVIPSSVITEGGGKSRKLYGAALAAYEKKVAADVARNAEIQSNAEKQLLRKREDLLTVEDKQNIRFIKQRKALLEEKPLLPSSEEMEKFNNKLKAISENAGITFSEKMSNKFGPAIKQAVGAAAPAIGFTLGAAVGGYLGSAIAEKLGAPGIVQGIAGVGTSMILGSIMSSPTFAATLTTLLTGPVGIGIAVSLLAAGPIIMAMKNVASGYKVAYDQSLFQTSLDTAKRSDLVVEKGVLGGEALTGKQGKSVEQLEKLGYKAPGILGGVWRSPTGEKITYKEMTELGLNKPGLFTGEQFKKATDQKKLLALATVIATRAGSQQEGLVMLAKTAKENANNGIFENYKGLTDQDFKDAIFGVYENYEESGLGSAKLFGEQKGISRLAQQNKEFLSSGNTAVDRILENAVSAPAISVSAPAISVSAAKAMSVIRSIPLSKRVFSSQYKMPETSIEQLVKAMPYSISTPEEMNATKEANRDVNVEVAQTISQLNDTMFQLAMTLQKGIDVNGNINIDRRGLIDFTMSNQKQKELTDLSLMGRSFPADH